MYLGLITDDLYKLSPVLYKNWKLYGVFYAFNPSLRPIPESTKLFNLKIRNYYPYDIYSYNYLYDIYLYDKNDIYSVNFITYNINISNTKKLYFYELNGGIFPTFEKEPPSKGEWKLLNISPIYVLSSDNDNFVCDNGNCIPKNTVGKSLNIDECLKKCNKTLNILEIIDNKDKDKDKDKDNINKNKRFYLLPFVFIFISVFLLFILKYLSME